MATWEDGPEYAPLTRPDHFDAPEVAPLDEAPPRARAVDDAPAERPRFGDPDQPVPALASLHAHDALDERDPTTAFETSTAALTSDTSAWSAAHWSPPTGPPVTPAVSAGWGPPTGTPASAESAPDPLGSGQRTVLRPPPAQPITLSSHHGAAQLPGQAPQPGTPEWFGPGPQAGPPAPLTLGSFLGAITPGVLIFLLAGGVIPVLSPILFVIAFTLSSRITVAAVPVRRTFIGASVALGLIGLILIFVGGDLSQWWGTFGLFSLVGCWAVLLIAAALVLRALQNGETSTPRRSNWG
ncbi:hypothetical protein [Microlunatus sp. Y2014]|uniref:hypothetical protein n=1 Tax=Microlunatus sp. Y2014 TaxID=3418488 RepID=UPI003DA76C74